MERKRWTALALAAVLALSLAACGGSPEEETDALFTVTKADGTVEALTLEELEEIYTGNEIAYNSDYLGCPVEVEGTVYRVEQTRTEIFDGLWADTAEFRLGSSGAKFWIVLGNEDYAGLDFGAISQGTRVKVSGTLGEAHVFIQIEDAHDLTILDEP